jgi:hypothetical protein
MREIELQNPRQNLQFFSLIRRTLSKDAGNVESALVLIPLLILFVGIIQLYSIHNIKSAMETVVQGVAESSISIQSTGAAQFAAEEYLTRPGLPKFIKSAQLEVSVVDEQFSDFVFRKVFLKKVRHSSRIDLFSLQVSATVILN